MSARIYEVEHSTVYAYAEAVEQSSHLLRLRPSSDRYQEVLDFSLKVTPAGSLREFEDVFGNSAVRLDFDSSFCEMRILSRSRVRVFAPARGLRETRERSIIPVQWMPWQREMMAAYLQVPDLSSSQLRDLYEYAMSFVERQDFDVVGTLEDINRTLHQDCTYEPGSTDLETTPWDVYVCRRGVCQDFANLFVCLARLLGIPARYRVGYVHSGVDDPRRLQSEASHAWAELYVPRLGWRGFDPTNGSVVGLDHVRVACGRNYRDATPTSGTIHRGGGGETLSIAVSVKEASLPP